MGWGGGVCVRMYDRQQLAHDPTIKPQPTKQGLRHPWDGHGHGDDHHGHGAGGAFVWLLFLLEGVLGGVWGGGMIFIYYLGLCVYYIWPATVVACLLT